MSERIGRSVEELATSVRDKHARLLELLQAISPGAFESLDPVHNIDVIFTSNALDGNSLSGSETAIVLEEGYAIGGKSLLHHMQVADHAHAMASARELAARDTQRPNFRAVSSGDLMAMNWGLTRRTKDVFENTFVGPHQDHTDRPPAPVRELLTWLKTQPDTPETAVAVHNRLIRAHPFVSGNEVTARLAMNFILLRGGFPPVAIRREDEAEYKRAIEDHDDDVIAGIVYLRLNDALDLYLSAAAQAQQ